MRTPRIDYWAHENWDAVLMAAQGFAASYIEERTGLSKGQIYYRMRQNQVKLSDYRKGKSEFAAVSRRLIAKTKVAALLRSRVVRKALKRQKGKAHAAA